MTREEAINELNEELIGINPNALGREEIQRWAVALDMAIKALKEQRPHGEWIHAEEYDYLDENGVEHFHIKCPNCGFLHDCFDCHMAQYNFCPNCGADMREGEEK